MQQNNPWQQNNDAVSDDILNLWDDTPIPESPSGTIPLGKYPARLVSGELATARTGNKYFRISWELDGAYAGRRLVSKHFLTPKAIARTKSEIGPLGIHGDHLRGTCPLPQVRAMLSVVQRTDETGDLFNEVKRVTAVTEQGQVNTPTASPGVPHAANDDMTSPTPVPIPETPCAPSQAADDDFLDEEF